MEREKKYILITGHIASDYDTLSSVICTSIIQENVPDGAFFNNLSNLDQYKIICYLPPTQYRHLMEFYENHRDNVLSSFNFIDGESPSQDIIDNTTHIIIVDTKKIARLKHIHKILYRSNNKDNSNNNVHPMIDPQLTISVFDHHPDSDDDIKQRDGDYPITIVSQQCGACTSIMVNKLKQYNISLSNDIATIIALGIYEDTGRLTYNSTNHIDFEAIEFIGRHNLKMEIIRKLGGKNLMTSPKANTKDSSSNLSTSSSVSTSPSLHLSSSINNMSNLASKMSLSYSSNNLLQISLMRSFNSEDMAIYESILKSIYTVHFGKEKEYVVHFGEIVFDYSPPSLSPIIQTIMELNRDIKTGIFLAQSPECIVIIGRSSQQKPDINVGQIVTQLGGGGHHHASSATIKNFGLQQTKNMIFLMILVQLYFDNEKDTLYQLILNNFQNEHIQDNNQRYTQLMNYLNQEKYLIKFNNVNNRQLQYYNEYLKSISASLQTVIEQLRATAKDLKMDIYLYGDTVYGIYKGFQKVGTISLFLFKDCDNQVEDFVKQISIIVPKKWIISTLDNSNITITFDKYLINIKIQDKNGIINQSNPSGSKVIYIGSIQHYSFQSLVVHLRDKDQFMLFDLFNSRYDIDHNHIRVNSSNAFFNHPLLLFSIIKESINNNMKISIETKRFIKATVLQEETFSKLRGHDYMDFFKWAFDQNDFLDILQTVHSFGLFAIFSESKDVPFGLPRSLDYFKKSIDWLNSIFYCYPFDRFNPGLKCLVYRVDKKFLMDHILNRLELSHDEMESFIKSSKQIKAAKKNVTEWVQSQAKDPKDVPQLFESMSIEDILVTRAITIESQQLRAKNQRATFSYQYQIPFSIYFNQIQDLNNNSSSRNKKV